MALMLKRCRRCSCRSNVAVPLLTTQIQQSRDLLDPNEPCSPHPWHETRPFQRGDRQHSLSKAFRHPPQHVRPPRKMPRLPRSWSLWLRHKARHLLRPLRCPRLQLWEAWRQRARRLGACIRDQLQRRASSVTPRPARQEPSTACSHKPSVAFSSEHPGAMSAMPWPRPEQLEAPSWLAK